MKLNRNFKKDEHIKQITGKEFRDSGALFLINQTLHLLGMAITWNPDTDELNASLCKFRGFGEEAIDEGYAKLTKYMRDNIKQLENDVYYKHDCNNCVYYKNKGTWFSCDGNYEGEGNCTSYSEAK